MSLKKDPVTDEEFECTGDSTCWCMDLPKTNLPPEGECIGPTRLKALIEAPKMQPIAEFVWNDKYRFFKSDGTTDEQTPEDSFRRVVKGIYANDKPEYAEQALQAMIRRDWMPAGRIHAGAGTGRRVTLINCFVSPTLEDSMESETGVGIMDGLKVAAITQQMGGGIGTDYSTIRPNGALVRRTGSVSSGILPFMDMQNAMCATIRSSGSRRGAMMGTLAIWHPDIKDFIKAKRTKGRLNNFNVSVLITDAFMEAVRNDKDWDLTFHVPRADGNHVEVFEPPQGSGEKPKYVYERLKARALWKLIIENTYEHAEPGVIFIDRVNHLNNLQYCETIHCTNPCGEQPLPPNGDCNLGHVNLARMVKHPFTDKAEIDWSRLRDAVRVGVRFLDNVLDVTEFPTEEQREEAQEKRRIGLGHTGLANMLQQLRLRYGSKKAIEVTEAVARSIAVDAYRASVELADERGSFPLFDAKAYRNAPFVKQLPGDLADAIAKHGLRNGVLLSIAPTGTTSNYYDVISSGCEPTFDWVYDRNVRKPGAAADEYQLYEDVMDYGFLLFRNHFYKDAKKVKISGRTVIAEVEGQAEPVTSTLPDYMVTALELTIEEHLQMQAAIQKWVDASISKTINCPQEMTFEEFEQVYLRAYELGLKGCTTYRPNDTRGVILIKKEDDQPKQEEPTRVLADRPIVLEGKTYKVRWTDVPHAFYVTINDRVEPDGRRIPFEIFINSKSVAHHEWISALTRTISAVFRRGGDVTFLIDELQQVFSPAQGQWTRGRYVSSLVAQIGIIMEEHFEAIGLIKKESEPKLITSDGEPKATGQICPRCGAPSLIHKEGCKECLSCGYSQCG